MKLQIFFSIFTCYIEILLFSGEILGFPFLQYILEQEGYFHNLCHNSTIKSKITFRKTTPNPLNILKTTCKEQEASFDLVFTLGISSLTLFGLINGYILDRFGTWIHRVLPNILKSLGYVFLIVSTPSTSYLLYPFSILNSWSGINLLISNIQIANFAKSIRSTLITLMEGTFDSSVVVFFLIKIGYDYGIHFRLMLLILLSLTTFLWLKTFLLMPRKHVPYPLPEEGFQYGWKEIKCCNQQVDLNADQTKPLLSHELNELNGENAIESSSLITFKDCLKNPLFWTNALFFSVNSLRLVFFNSSLLYWLKHIAGNGVSKSTNIFGIFILFGIFFAPFNGFIIDGANKLLKSKETNDEDLVLKTSLISLTVTYCFSVVFSLMTVIPSVYWSFIFYLLMRSFVYSGNASFIALNFPSYHFGKLYGLTFLIFGVVNFLHYALFRLALRYSFYFVNLSLLVAVLLTSVHLAAIYIKIRHKTV